MKRHIEVTEEEAEDFVATLKQAGIREHTTTELGSDAIIDIYENDRLHSEVWRMLKSGGQRISLTMRGRRQRSQEQNAAGSNAVAEVAEQTVDEDLKAAFAELARSWSTDTAHVSSPIKLMKHPAYQQIIGFGAPVLPLILRDLAESGRFWFPALNAITGENPVPDDAAGDIEKMTRAWIEWGRENGLA
jgi:hypothetical protein